MHNPTLYCTPPVLWMQSLSDPVEQLRNLFWKQEPDCSSHLQLPHGNQYDFCVVVGVVGGDVIGDVDVIADFTADDIVIDFTYNKSKERSDSLSLQLFTDYSSSIWTTRLVYGLFV